MTQVCKSQDAYIFPLEETQHDGLSFEKGSQDRSRINLNEEYEVRYWTEALGVSREELQRLVNEHGSSAQKIREHLGKAA
jgi:Protein of unknown function (DUF3606)